MVLTLILSGLLIISVIIIIILLTKLKKRDARIYVTTSDYDKIDEIMGLVSLQSIIISDSESNLPFFEMTFNSSDLNTSLIVGLTNAIRNLMDEVHEGLMGYDIIQRSGLSIVSHQAEITTLTLITKNPPPRSILNQLSGSHFEIDKSLRLKILNKPKLNELESEILEIFDHFKFKFRIRLGLIISPKFAAKLELLKNLKSNIYLGLEYLLDLGLTYHEPGGFNVEYLIDHLQEKGFETNQIYEILHLACSEKLLISA